MFRISYFGFLKEVIISWEEYKKIEKSLRLDLSQEAIDDLNRSSTSYSKKMEKSSKKQQKNVVSSLFVC